MERQGHASVDDIEQDQEQQITDLHISESEVVGSTPVVPPSPPVAPSQTTWDQNLYDANWQLSNSDPHFGIVSLWFIVNL